jgi:hypothetical protein
MGFGTLKQKYDEINKSDKNLKIVTYNKKHLLCSQWHYVQFKFL